MKDPTPDWANAFVLIVSLVAVMWIAETIDGMTRFDLGMFGIYPRELSSLPGVLLWPFLHGNFGHLIVNTTPLLILGFFVALRGWRVFLSTSALIVVLAGICIWVFGRSAYHIGSSGLVFGYFGFLIAIGIYEKSISALAIASFTIFYYGGMIYGVLPRGGFVSWEAHFFGLCAGVLAARRLWLESHSP